jgi:hypothetical protein
MSAETMLAVLLHADAVGSTALSQQTNVFAQRAMICPSWRCRITGPNHQC